MLRTDIKSSNIMQSTSFAGPEIIEFIASQRFFYLLETTSSKNINSLSIAFEIEGKIDAQALEKSIKTLVQRHVMLRSKITSQNTGPSFEIIPFEILEKNREFLIERTAHSDDTNITLEYLKSSENSIPLNSAFKIEQEPLVRFFLIRFNETRSLFIIDANHLVLDQYSMNILVGEISILYNSFLLQKSANLEPLANLTKLNFKISKISDEDKNIKINKEQRIEFFKNVFKDFSPLNLIHDTDDQPDFDFSGKSILFNLSNNLVSELQDQYPDFSLNAILTASFIVQLHLLTNDKTICIGYPSANRDFRYLGMEGAITKNLVNCFVNTIPLLIHLDKKHAFIDVLEKVKQLIKLTTQNQLPLDTFYTHALNQDIKERLQTATPFAVMFSVNKDISLLNLHNTQSKPVEISNDTCKFLDFGVKCDKQSDGNYLCKLEYNSALYAEKSRRLFVERWLNLLKILGKSKTTLISDLPILTAMEISSIQKYNTTIKDFGFHGFYPDWFHQKARQFPQNIALVRQVFKKPKQQLSFYDLDRLSSVLSNFMHVHFDIQLGDKIAISLPTSIEHEIIKLSISKLGAIEIPIDSEGQEKINNKMNLLKPKLVFADKNTFVYFENFADLRILKLTENTLTQKALLFNTGLISHENFEFDFDTKSEASYCSPKLTNSSTAYFICTSGTSQNNWLKVVEISHGGFINLLLDANSDSRENFYTTSPETFDAGKYDKRAWACGGTIFLPAKIRLSAAEIDRQLRTQDIATIVLTPPVLRELDQDNEVKNVIVMGSSPSEKLLKKWSAKHNVYAAYGVTECTVANTKRRPYQMGDNPHWIGNPIANTFIYLGRKFGDTFKLCNIGEILISGPCVMKGYYNNPTLNEKKLVSLMQVAPDKFLKSTAKGSQVFYRTGDYACLDLNNDNEAEIRFLGRRKDGQVKIQQTNVHLPSIEVALCEHPDVEEALVVPHPENTGVIAGIVPKNNVNWENLEIQLKELFLIKHTHLPHVALPKLYIKLDTIPKSENGKTNFAYLLSKFVKSDSLKQPVNNTQKLIRKILADSLKRPEESISIDDPFRYLGDSISLMVFTRKINKNLPHLFSQRFFDSLDNRKKFHLDLKFLNKMTTIESLDKAIRNEEQKASIKFNSRYNPNQSVIQISSLFSSKESPLLLLTDKYHRTPHL